MNKIDFMCIFLNESVCNFKINVTFLNFLLSTNICNFLKSYVFAITGKFSNFINDHLSFFQIMCISVVN